MNRHEIKQAAENTTRAGGSVHAHLAEDRDLLLRVARGDGRAQRLLGNRLVTRVRRAAHALMRGSLDAEDAAQHALIEILRSARGYAGDVPVERWADRITGRSVIRFARAVRRRNSGAGSLDADAVEHVESEVAPRNVSELLSTSAPARREVLLLRHAFGHGVDEIAELTQASLSTVQERLLTARRDLRRLVPIEGSTKDTERWVYLRDREALGEALTEAELAEVARIERSDAHARAYAAHTREVESHLAPRAAERLTDADHDLVDRALAAVQVSTSPTRMRSSDPDAEIERAVDPEGPGWIRTASLGFSVALAATAVIALVVYEPRSVRRADRDAIDPASLPIAPTVEALASAHTGKRGGRLKRGDELLAPNVALGAKDELSAGDKPGCIVLEPGTDVCLAPFATIRLEDLALQGRVVEVVRGRVAASSDPTQGPLTLRSGDVYARAVGAVFGMERSDDASVLRARVLKGRVQVTSSAGGQDVSAQQTAVVRPSEASVSLEALPEGQAQREWELLAWSSAANAPARGELAPVVVSAAAPAAIDPADPVPEPAGASPEVVQLEPVAAAPAPTLAKTMPPFDPRTTAAFENKAPAPSTPRDLVKLAWEHLKARRWTDAARTYETLLREHPKSEEAHASLVRLADLQLEYLAQPAAAVATYDRYLREGGGALEAEARFGRIQAFARQRRAAEERTAILEFLRLYPASAKVPPLRERLESLEP